MDRSNPTRIVIKISVPAQSLPPEPARRKQLPPPGNTGRSMLDFPKCPIDRGRNEPEKPQVIFWDEQKQCYICRHGHQFTGKE